VRDADAADVALNCFPPEEAARRAAMSKRCAAVPGVCHARSARSRSADRGHEPL
jgi:hypothetical protein